MSSPHKSIVNLGRDGKGYGGTSTTSLTIAESGTKVFTTQKRLAYTAGARVRATDAATAARWMEGTITYSGALLTMTVDRANGTGTCGDWKFNIAGEPGIAAELDVIDGGTPGGGGGDFIDGGTP